MKENVTDSSLYLNFNFQKIILIKINVEDYLF